MATFFQAGQYEADFWPHRIRNYEIPHPYKQRPDPRCGFTRVQSNDRGHLLPGVKRSLKNPWGNFVGTWDLPKKLPGPRVQVETSRKFSKFDRQRRAADDAEDVIRGYMKNGRRNIRIESVGTKGKVRPGQLGRISPAQRHPCQPVESEALKELDALNVLKECRMKPCKELCQEDLSTYDEMCCLKKGLKDGPGKISPTKGYCRPRQTCDQEHDSCCIREDPEPDNPLTYLTPDVVKYRGRQMVQPPQMDDCQPCCQQQQCVPEGSQREMPQVINYNSSIPNRANLIQRLKNRCGQEEKPDCRNLDVDMQRFEHKSEYRRRFGNYDRDKVCDELVNHEPPCQGQLPSLPPERNPMLSEYQVKFMDPKVKIEQLLRGRRNQPPRANHNYECNPQVEHVTELTPKFEAHVPGCQDAQPVCGDPCQPCQPVCCPDQSAGQSICNTKGGFMYDPSCYPCKPNDCSDELVCSTDDKPCPTSTGELLDTCPPHDDIPIKPLGPLCQIPETDRADGLPTMFQDLCIKPRYESGDDVLCCRPDPCAPCQVECPETLPDRESKPKCDVYDFLSEKSNPDCTDELDKLYCRVYCEPEPCRDYSGSVYKCEDDCEDQLKPVCAYKPCSKPDHVDDCLAAPYQTVDMELMGPKAQFKAKATPCDPLSETGTEIEHDCIRDSNAEVGRGEVNEDGVL